MKISIDEDIVKSSSTWSRQSLTISELLTCLIVKLGDNPINVTNNLVVKGILHQDIYNQSRLLILSEYNDLMQSIILDSDKAVPKIDSIQDLVSTLQNIFPKGRKCDEYGIPKWSWRGNKTDLTRRLQKFFKLYGEYNYSDIIEATKKYVKRMSGDKFMRVLPYFILSQNAEKSDLADELENLDSEDTIQTTLTDELI